MVKKPDSSTDTTGNSYFSTIDDNNNSNSYVESTEPANNKKFGHFKRNDLSKKNEIWSYKYVEQKQCRFYMKNVEQKY